MEDGVLFQVNQTGINFCSRCMMDFPVPSIPHKHKSNGTVYCVLGNEVWYQCMDPDCVGYIRGNGYRLYTVAKCVEVSVLLKTMGRGGSSGIVCKYTHVWHCRPSEIQTQPPSRNCCDRAPYRNVTFKECWTCCTGNRGFCPPTDAAHHCCVRRRTEKSMPVARADGGYG